MNELRVDIGGSTSGFEMATAQTKIMAKRLQSELSGFTFTPPKIVNERDIPISAMRSFQHILSDIYRLDFERLPYSFMHLAHELGILGGVSQAANSATRILADSYAALATKQATAAAAAALKADTSAAAIVTEGEESEATFQAALADEAKAVAARQAAVATAQKAEAAKIAAAAEEEEAAATAASVGVIGTLVAVIAAVIVVVAIWWGKIKLLTEALGGVKLPDFNPEYIAKHLQKVNQVAEGWKQINKEVKEAIDNYNSATSIAQRAADATKEHYNHLRKMNELSPGTQVDKDKRLLEINKAERNAELANKYDEQANLSAEAKRKKSAADAINVSSKEADENIRRAREGRAKAAEKYLSDTDNPKFKAKAAEWFAEGLGTSGASKAEIANAKLNGKMAAAEYIKEYRAWVDQEAANDEARKKKKELTDQAAKSASTAAVVALQIDATKKTDAQKNKDDADEQAAKRYQKGVSTHVDSLSGAGLFTSAGAVMNPLVDIGYKQLSKLTDIHNAINALNNNNIFSP
jgi:hypothetical protein